MPTFPSNIVIMCSMLFMIAFIGVGVSYACQKVMTRGTQSELEYFKALSEMIKNEKRRKNKAAHRNRVKPCCYPKPHLALSKLFYRSEHFGYSSLLIRKKSLSRQIKKRLLVIPLRKKTCPRAQHRKQRPHGA